MVFGIASPFGGLNNFSSYFLSNFLGTFQTRGLGSNFTQERPSHKPAKQDRKKNGGDEVRYLDLRKPQHVECETDDHQ